MSGWDRMEADWWESVVEGLLASGQPWPAGARLMDLRTIQRECLFGRRRSWPSKRELAKRWGCGASTALRVVREEEWQDPARAEQWARWCSDHGVDHLRTSDGPGVDHSTSEESGESGGGGPPADQARTSRGHRRVGDTQNPKGSSLSLSAHRHEGDQGPEDGAAQASGQSRGAVPRPPPGPVQQAIDLWMSLQHGLAHPRPTPEEELKLEALIGEIGLDAVLEVVRWWWSGHRQACWLRSEGYSWSTLVKPEKARGYLHKARTEPADQPPPPPQQRRRGGERRRPKAPVQAGPPPDPPPGPTQAELLDMNLHLLEMDIQAGNAGGAVRWSAELREGWRLAELQVERLEVFTAGLQELVSWLEEGNQGQAHLPAVREQLAAWTEALAEARRGALRVVHGGES